MILLLGLFSSLLPSYAQNSDEPMTYFFFGRHNSMNPFDGLSYMAKLLDNGKVQIIINEGYPDEKEIITDDKTIFDDLTEISERFNMRKYKSNYSPDTHITDGNSWSLSILFGKNYKNSISSRGYMAGPKNYAEAKKAIIEYFMKWKEYEVPERQVTDFIFTIYDADGKTSNITLCATTRKLNSQCSTPPISSTESLLKAHSHSTRTKWTNSSHSSRQAN